MLKKVYQQLQKLLPPEPCALCGQPIRDPLPLCNRCRPKLPMLASVPLELQRVPLWDQVIIPFHYREPLSPLIHQLKFDHKLHLSRLFGLLMLEKLQQSPLGCPDLIIPVPLHHNRLQERGFNQALEIIRGPARALQISLGHSHCRRTRNTTAQMGLNARARKQNLDHAFSVTRPLQGAHVALFDDVITTGSTMRAVATTLKKAGAKKIDLWALAYTPPHR